VRIKRVEDYQELSREAAKIVSSQIVLKPDSVLGLATGSTPVGMYENLVQMHQAGEIDFKEVTTFNLDEYLDISPGHPQSYHYYMYDKFFNYVNIPKIRINIPPGTEDNLEQSCLKYDRDIKDAGGIDLQVLGIGTNGHIGFNEPDNKLNAGTHIVELAEETIEDNSRFFDSRAEVPKQAISMGMGNILKADRILLLASGERKAEAIQDTIKGKITTEVPGSLLQLHDEVIVIIDKEAGELL
jgi:glucosamine-6-phosphate deaminase